MGFSFINHPAIGVPPWPWKTLWLYLVMSGLRMVPLRETLVEKAPAAPCCGGVDSAHLPRKMLPAPRFLCRPVRQGKKEMGVGKYVSLPLKYLKSSIILLQVEPYVEPIPFTITRTPCQWYQYYSGQTPPTHLSAHTLGLSSTYASWMYLGWLDGWPQLPMFIGKMVSNRPVTIFIPESIRFVRNYLTSSVWKLSEDIWKKQKEQ